MVRITSFFIVMGSILGLNLFVSIVAAAEGNAPATQAIRRPVTADEASRILLTRDNWRDVENRLGDVYENASIANQRDQAMDDFTDVMKRADKETDLIKRGALREKAHDDLTSQASALLKAANAATDESVKNEMLVAAMELQFRAGDYATVIVSGEQLLKQLPKTPLKCAAYCYVIESHQKKLQRDAGEQLRGQGNQEMGNGMSQYFSAFASFGHLRIAIQQFSAAQGMDDQILTFKDTQPELAAKMIDARDKAIQLGEEMAKPPRKLRNSEID
ncbi:MAG TPA: hypothetical protein VHS31_09935 [Tepidisphaeraceae bacterium]|jgi:hypothetical protein|nr:hypothetical protein [Tepidisphaeraceae bacterium]